MMQHALGGGPITFSASMNDANGLLSLVDGTQFLTG